jgi:hypothetical protein
VGLCTPCTNKHPTTHDYEEGRLHDDIHVGIVEGASYTIRQRFIVDGGQVAIHDDGTIYFNSIVGVSRETITIAPEKLD